MIRRRVMYVPWCLFWLLHIVQWMLRVCCGGVDLRTSHVHVGGEWKDSSFIVQVCYWGS